MGVKLNFLRAGRVVNLISDIVTSDLTFLCTCMCAQDSLRHPSYSWQNAKWAQSGKKICNGYFLYECGDQTL